MDVAEPWVLQDHRDQTMAVVRRQVYLYHWTLGHVLVASPIHAFGLEPFVDEHLGQARASCAYFKREAGRARRAWRLGDRHVNV